MRARNGLEPVDMVELGRDLVAKEPARPTGTHSPGIDVLRVAPHEVAEGPLVRDLLGPRHDADLVDRADLGAQPAVHAEHRAVDDGGQHQEVEDLAARLPH